jgi:hypothetical protein
VVLAFRSVSGSSSRARWRAALSSPIARIAEFVLLTRSVRSPRRSAIADTVSAPSRRNCDSTRWSSASSCVSREVEPRKGAKYLMLWPASAPASSYCVPVPRMKSRRPPRVFLSRVLKRTSMSTGDVVESAPMWPPSSISSELLGPGFSEM